MLERPVSKAGWTRVRFDQMATNVSERVDPGPDDNELYIGLEHLDSGTLRVRRWGSEVALKGTKLRMCEGDILFAKRNAYLKRVAIAPHDGLFSAHGLVLRAKPEGVLPECLPFFMQSDLFMERAIGISVGSLSPTINWKSLAAEEFLLPPIQQQARLVEALSAAETAGESLRNLEHSSEVALMAVLKAMTGFGSLTTLGQLVDDGLIAPPQDGNHGDKHPKESDYVDDGVPFVMASDLIDGRVDFVRCKKLPKALAEGLRIGFAHRGDVLLSHKGTVGQVALLSGLKADYAMLTPQVTYYRVLDTNRLDSQWLFYSFLSSAFQRQLRRYERQSTRAYVGITTQRELKIPMCEISEQRLIIGRLNAMSKAQSEARLRRRTLGEFYSKLLSNGFEQ